MNEPDLPEVRIPLYRVGEWIATCGGARDLGPSLITVENKDVPDYTFSYKTSPVHARAWDKSLVELLKAIHAGRLRVEGLRDGDAGGAFEEIAPGEFGDEAANPFGRQIEMFFSERRILEFYTDNSARVITRWHTYWSEIRAYSREDVLAIWPATTKMAPSPYISLAEAWKKFCEAERETERDESGALNALVEKFRGTVALPLSNATYCETRGALKKLTFEDWFVDCAPSLLKSDSSSFPMAVLFERDAFDALDIAKSWQQVAPPPPMTDDNLRRWLRAKESELGERPRIRTWQQNMQFFQDRGVRKERFERIWREMYPTAEPGRPSKNVPRNASRIESAKEVPGNPDK